MKIQVGVSNRHIHLSKEDFVNLVGDKEFCKVKDLTQGGEFASNILVSIKTDKNTINNVRVVGPLREKTQVEISVSDCYFLGLRPPIRMSGDFRDAESCTLVYEGKELFVNGGVIVANRHIHVNTRDLEKYNFHDGDVFSVRVGGQRGGVLNNVIVKSKDSYNLELHLDTDEANAMGLKNGDVVDIIER